MNITVLSLIYSSLYSNSPSFIGNNISLSNCNFQKTFPLLFYNQLRLKVTDTAFNKGYNGIILISDPIKNGNLWTFSETFNSAFETDKYIGQNDKIAVTFIGCLFKDFGNYENVHPLKIERRYVSVYITRSTFANCKSVEGVLILKQCRCITLTHICSINSKSNSRSSFCNINCNPEDFFIFLYSTIATESGFDGNGEENVFCQSGDQHFRCINITNFFSPTRDNVLGVHFEDTQCFSFGMTNIINVKGRSIEVTGKNDKGQVYVFENINVVTDVGNSNLVRMDSENLFQVRIYDSVLLNKNSGMFEHGDKKQFKLNLINCLYSVNNGAMGDVETDGCKSIGFDLSKVVTYKLFANDSYCRGPELKEGEMVSGCNVEDCVNPQCERSIGFPDDVVPYPTFIDPKLQTYSFTPSKGFTPSFVFTNSQSFTSSQSFTPSKTFLPSKPFTQSSTFSKSYLFTSSCTFTKSGSFTKSVFFSSSSSFTGSGSFSKSHSFTGSRTFTGTSSFSKSAFFSKSHSFTKSSSFTKSQKFSESKQFTLSSKFSKSDVFSISMMFSGTFYFTKTGQFTSSDDFTKSATFTDSKCFTPSSNFNATHTFTPSRTFTASSAFNASSSFSDSFFFTYSEAFTSTNKFSGTTAFSESVQFTDSKDFTKTGHFTLSKKFTSSNDFSKSDAFTSSRVFTASNNFDATKTFSPSSSFTSSDHFTRSNKFTSSRPFSGSKSFTSSQSFTPTVNFTLSSTFSLSSHFTSSDHFIPSNTFTPSSHFTSSSSFTPSNSFTASSCFTSSQNFTKSSTFAHTETLQNKIIININKSESKNKKLIIGGAVAASVFAVGIAAFIIAFIIVRHRRHQQSSDMFEELNPIDDMQSTITYNNVLHGLDIEDDPFEDDFQDHIH